MRERFWIAWLSTIRVQQFYNTTILYYRIAVTTYYYRYNFRLLHRCLIIIMFSCTSLYSRFIFVHNQCHSTQERRAFFVFTLRALIIKSRDDSLLSRTNCNTTFPEFSPKRVYLSTFNIIIRGKRVEIKIKHEVCTWLYKGFGFT